MPHVPSPSSLPGTHPGDVLRVLRERAAGNRRPDARVGLVLEGGGMRGLLSAAGLVALELAGFENAFDAVYGASAGAINGAFFVAGQSAFGTAIYYREIANRSFIDPWRRPHRLLNLNFLIDDVMVHRRPLNTDAVLASSTDLYAYATAVQRGNARRIRVQDGTWPVLEVLRASAALPVFDNQRVPLGDETFVDGGITRSLPVTDALADACTHLLVLRTRPIEYVDTPPTWLERRVFHWRSARDAPALNSAFHRRHLENAQDRDLAAGRMPAPADATIASIGPTPSIAGIHRLTRDPSALLQAAIAQTRYVLTQLGVPRLDDVEPTLRNA